MGPMGPVNLTLRFKRLLGLQASRAGVGGIRASGLAAQVPKQISASPNLSTLLATVQKPSNVPHPPTEKCHDTSAYIAGTVTGRKP